MTQKTWPPRRRGVSIQIAAEPAILDCPVVGHRVALVIGYLAYQAPATRETSEMPACSHLAECGLASADTGRLDRERAGRAGCPLAASLGVWRPPAR
jgi:hypothetical protein